MSQGAFLETKYQADNGDVHPIRVQPETVAASLGTANIAPTGAVTIDLFATARKSKRSYGVGARTARLRFTGAVPDGYKPGQVLTVPVLTIAVYNGLTRASTITYLGQPAALVGKSAETKR